jgi:hypothetical protein
VHDAKEVLAALLVEVAERHLLNTVEQLGELDRLRAGHLAVKVAQHFAARRAERVPVKLLEQMLEASSLNTTSVVAVVVVEQRLQARLVEHHLTARLTALQSGDAVAKRLILKLVGARKELGGARNVDAGALPLAQLRVELGARDAAVVIVVELGEHTFDTRLVGLFHFAVGLAGEHLPETLGQRLFALRRLSLGLSLRCGRICLGLGLGGRLNLLGRLLRRLAARLGRHLLVDGVELAAGAGRSGRSRLGGRRSGLDKHFDIVARKAADCAVRRVPLPPRAFRRQQIEFLNKNARSDKSKLVLLRDNDALGLF